MEIPQDAVVGPDSTEAPLVTICIPHFQVMELMQFCLRAIRQYTDGPKYEVIVVDTASQDESLDWLRTVEWIRLIERRDEEMWPQMQAIHDAHEGSPPLWVLAMNTALDTGLEHARGRYYLIMHSDTIVKRNGWLTRMVEALESDEKVGSVGAMKLEMDSLLTRFLKKSTDTKPLRLWLRRNLLRDERAKPQLKREPCARDYCALYRTDVLRENKLSFITRGGYSAGEVLHYALKKLGYQTSLIPVREMMGMMDHIAHATGAIVPELKHAKSRTVNKAQRRLKSLFNRNDVTDLMNAESLDKLA